MIEFLGVSLILFVLIALPLLVIVGGVVANTAIKQYFRLMSARLELDRERFEREHEVRRLSAELPPWLDVRDPMEVAAWRRAVGETAALVAREN